jgi:hypothetical protein
MLLAIYILSFLMRVAVGLPPGDLGGFEGRVNRSLGSADADVVIRQARRLLPILALLAVSCRSRDSCPEGMRALAERSTPGSSTWCKSPDGRAAQWMQVFDKTRQLECRYVDGQAHGVFRGMFTSGKQWIEGQYDHGRKEGLWRQWDTSGSLVAEGTYRSGRLVEGAPVGMAARCETATP